MIAGNDWNILGIMISLFGLEYNSLYHAILKTGHNQQLSSASIIWIHQSRDKIHIGELIVAVATRGSYVLVDNK